MPKEDANSSGHLFCPTLGLACVLMLRTISLELVLFLDFWVSNIPWHDLLMPHGCLCPWSTFYASRSKTQNGNSGAPMMVSITIMSSWIWVNFRTLSIKHCWHDTCQTFRPFFRIWLFTLLCEVSIEHLQRVRHAKRRRLLLRTPFPVPLWDLHVF